MQQEAGNADERLAYVENFASCTTAAGDSRRSPIVSEAGANSLSARRHAYAGLGEGGATAFRRFPSKEIRIDSPHNSRIPRLLRACVVNIQRANGDRSFPARL